MFGTSGIRGVVGKDITVELALNIGAAVGEESEKLTIGRDTRTTGETLENAVAAGALSTGSKIETLGIVPTPTTARYADDKALEITASHNPSEYNGFKPFNTDGTAFNQDQRKRVEKAVKKGEINYSKEFNDEIKIEDALNSHKSEILKSVKEIENTKVVVDGGCGAASEITPKLLADMGCEVITLNCQKDGRFPGRLPEPTEENLKDLKKIVKDTDADLGIAHDGDGDRTAAIDEKGNYVEADKLLCLFAIHEKAEEVVAPVNTSSVIEHVTEVRRTKVGDVRVAQELKENGGKLGGEPSNTWIFPEQTYCPDGVLAAAKLCEIAEEGKISEKISNLPNYSVRRKNFKCEDGRKKEVMEKFKEESKNMGKITTLDGVRVDTENGWFLVRPSGTEPYIRATSEAKDKKRADKLLDMVEETLSRIL